MSKNLMRDELESKLTWRAMKIKAVDYIIVDFLLIFCLLGCTGGKKLTEVESGANDVMRQARSLAIQKTCTSCHSLDGQPGVGPTFMHLYGKTETLKDGSQIVVNDEYIRESIRDPQAKVVQRYAPSMPAIPLTEEEMEKILFLIRSLAKHP